MKKLLSISIILIAILALSGCKSNTPSAVVEKSCQCLIDKDYKGYVDLIAFKDDADPEKLEEQKAQMVSMLEDKLGKSNEKKGGVKSCKVLSEQINEEEKTAVVSFEVTYGDGTTEQEEQKLKQNDNGEWMLDVGK